MSLPTPEWHRAHPIFTTDFSLPPDQIIEKIRIGISNLRGQLSDVAHGYPGFADQLATAENGLTLVISYLYGIKGEMAACTMERDAAEKSKGGES